MTNTPNGFDRFKYEQDLMETWSISNSIELIANSLKKDEICVDHAVKALEGLSILLALRLDVLYQGFEKSGLKLK